MGNNMSQDLAQYVTDMRQSITIQLRSNHYPPIPYEMVDPCIDAINAYNDGEPSKEIPLPDGISWRGKESAPAYAIIEGHHLDAWCES